ncbi:hypothetical protein ACWDE9_33260, partial [Streptomyces olivaceoviridis]
MPPGARSFATDPDHYDIAGATRCVKDGEPAGVHLATDKSGGLVLDFAPVMRVGVRLAQERVGAGGESGELGAGPAVPSVRGHAPLACGAQAVAIGVVRDGARGQP